MSKMSQLNMDLCEMFNVDDLSDVKDMTMGEMMERLDKARKENPERAKRVRRESAKSILEDESTEETPVEKMKKAIDEYGEDLAMASMLADIYNNNKGVKGYLMIVDDGSRTIMIGKGKLKWYKTRLEEFVDKLNEADDED